MRLKVLTTCDRIEGFKRLEDSLKRFGYEYECIIHPFSFGHQLPVIRTWCHNNSDYTHILYTDAFDTLALAGPEELLSKWDDKYKMVISGEKNCYPHPERAKDYPETPYPWKYVNGGGWIVEVDYFKHLCQKENLNQDSHDQAWLMDVFLRNQNEIKIDNSCEIFQTIAFSYPEEWEQKEQRFVNKGTGTSPIFFHGNGHTEMGWVYKILQEKIEA